MIHSGRGNPITKFSDSGFYRCEKISEGQVKRKGTSHFVDTWQEQNYKNPRAEDGLRKAKDFF